MAYGYKCGEDFWDCGCCKSCWPDNPCAEIDDEDDEDSD